MTDAANVMQRRRAAVLGVVVFLGVMALVVGVFLVARNERQFAMQQWETRLKTVSAQPLVRVAQWLNEGHAALHAVAINPTVQINLSEAAAGNAGAPTPESTANAIFLSGYLASLSGRGAFASDTPAGVAGSAAGLAVIDTHGRIVAATRGYHPASSLVRTLIAALGKGEQTPAISQNRGRTLIAFAASVQPLQAPMSAAPVGYVVGERSVSDAFWASDGSALIAERGHESLVAADSGRPPVLIGASIPVSQMSSAGELRAAQTPLHLVQATDLSGAAALHLGIPVKDMPWMLVETVPVKTALAGVDGRVRDLLIMLLLALLAIIAAVFALWRHNIAQQQAQAREASVGFYRGIVALLLEAIDLRDPGAAEHSRRVGALSRDIALQMALPRNEADSVELAGALLNVGKLFVPSDLLTKVGSLSEMERGEIDAASLRWLNLLAQVPFDPPLEPTLRAAYDLMQGNTNSAARDAYRDAYIVVVANTAVALMSPRAYRPAHSREETLKLMSDDAVRFPSDIKSALQKIFFRTTS